MNYLAQQLHQHWNEMVSNSARTLIPGPDRSPFATKAWSYILVDWKENNQIDSISFPALLRLENYSFVKASYDLGKDSGYSPKTLEALGQLIKDIEHSAQDWRTFPAIIYKRNFEDGRFNFLRMNEFLKIFNEKLELEQQMKVEPSQTAKSTPSTLSTTSSFKI